MTQDLTKVRRALKVLVLGIVVLQRLAIPAGSGHVSLVLVVALLVLGFLLLEGAVVEDRGRTIGYLLAATACLLAALVAGVRGVPVSLTSVGLLCLAYLPFCFSLREQFGALMPELLRFFTTVMTGVAVVAIGQFAAQLAGVWHYTDLLAGIVPERFILPGFTTTYPIQYGSGIFKSNGLVMVEPSFCSQFLALAVIAHLLFGTGRHRIAIFAAAIVTTVSGTGLIVLGVGLSIQVIRRGRRFAIAAGALVVCALVIVMGTPLGGIYSQRSGEIFTRSSSAHQRFIEPYTRMWMVIGRSDAVLLSGEGPGFADRDALRFNALTKLPLSAPPPAKLIEEYGLLAGLLFAGFLGYAVMARVRSTTLAAAVLASYFVLSAGSLLVAHTIFICWLFAALFARPSPGAVVPWLGGRRVVAAAA